MIKLIVWLLSLLRRERFDIGRPGLPDYLTRWTLLGKRYGGSRRVFLHWFHRGDEEPYFHDHPWAFVSVILWGGYYEETPTGRHWYGPGSVLVRPAEWRHRVVLHEGRQAWTLVLSGPKTRGWGFWCDSGWIPWKSHAANIDAGQPGCGGDT